MKNTYDEMIAVLQARKEGKIIEYRHSHEMEWVESTKEVPLFDSLYYRVKTEPRLFYVVDWGGNRGFSVATLDKTEALDKISLNPGAKLILTKEELT